MTRDADADADAALLARLSHRLRDREREIWAAARALARDIQRAVGEIPLTNIGDRVATPPAIHEGRRMNDGNDKGMLNEILPDPTRGAEDLADGLPRRRTAEHLRKIVAAGLALQLTSDMAGCSSPDPTPPKAPEMAQPGEKPVTRASRAPWLPPNGQGYGWWTCCRPLFPFRPAAATSR